MRREHISCGFSVVELMVALAIVAILAGLATPALTTWKLNHQLYGAAANLAADLELAKMRAIRENSFVAVVFAAGGYTIFVDNGVGGGDPGDWVRSGEESLVQQRDFPPGVQIRMDDLTLADSRVRFNGRGFPMDVPATETIPVTNPKGTRQVTLSRVGNVRVN